MVVGWSLLSPDLTSLFATNERKVISHTSAYTGYLKRKNHNRQSDLMIKIGKDIVSKQKTDTTTITVRMERFPSQLV